MTKLTRVHILMVEDNPGDQFLLSELIRASKLANHLIIKAETLAEAIIKAAEYPVDIILLDLSLPDSSGIDSFTQIRAVAPLIPVVILSGLTDTNVALDAINQGAQDYLVKGDFDEKLLAKTILYSIERVRNMNELKESNERYNLVSKATNDMVWDWDLITGTVYRNREGWKKIFKTAAAETDLGTEYDWDSRVHPEDRAKAKDIQDFILQSKDKNFFEVECRAMRDDGNYAYLLDRGYIIRNANGTAIRVIGATQDITERKLSEQKVMESEKRFRSLVQNSSDIISIFNQTGHYLYSSPAVRSILGYEPEAMLGKNAFGFIHPEDVQLLKDQIEKSQYSTVKPFRFRAANGEWRWLESKMTDMSSNPEINGYILNSRDVTEKVLLEKTLELERLAKQNEITDAVISAQEAERQDLGRELHDNINQILATSRLYLGLVKTTEVGDRSLLEETDNLVNSAIQEIRSLSHSLIPPSLEDSELLGAVEHLIGVNGGASGINICLQAEGFDERLISDKMKLTIYRIIQEQFHNILKYASATEVVVELLQEGNKTTLTIRDNGVGFDTSLKPRGVGLMNIKTRASLFNGNLSVQSSPGAGCSVSVCFN